MKKTLLFVILFACAPLVDAQYYTMLKFRAEYLYGTILKQDERIAKIVDKPVMGAELSVEIMPNGRMEWPQYYNGASLGFAAAFLDLGNTDVLGQVVALYPYVNIPVVRTKWFCLGLKPGAGISCVTKTFNNTAPPGTNTLSNPDGTINTAVGSVVNAYFTGAVTFEVPIYKSVGISGSVGWNHLSNGSILAPNAGLNMINGQVGVTYFPRYDWYNRIYVPQYAPYYKKQFSYELTLSGGCRELYYRDDQMYMIGSLALNAHYSLARIFRLGLGVDAFYDGVFGGVYSTYAHAGDKITYFKKTYITENKFANKVRVGLSVQPEMVLGRFVAGIHLGVYMYDPIKNLEPFAEAEAGTVDKGLFYKYDIDTEDGWFYTRVAAKYFVTDHFFVAVGLKTHLHKAEFIEWGVGVKL